VRQRGRRSGQEGWQGRRTHHNGQLLTRLPPRDLGRAGLYGELQAAGGHVAAVRCLLRSQQLLGCRRHLGGSGGRGSPRPRTLCAHSSTAHTIARASHKLRADSSDEQRRALRSPALAIKSIKSIQSRRGRENIRGQAHTHPLPSFPTCRRSRPCSCLGQRAPSRQAQPHHTHWVAHFDLVRARAFTRAASG
jgi:hypothetical protein